MKILKKIKSYFHKILDIHQRIQKIQEALGRIEARQISLKNSVSEIEEVEFQVFSQWGEDGILEYLVQNIKIDQKIFVEFGVENYTESNTRFLLMHRNWSGLVMDGDPGNIEYIKKDSLYWKYNLKAVCAFISKDNINGLLLENGLKGEIGILSIDIDGNDYWIWQEIDCIKPAIVVVEYNSLFGDKAKITVPYQKDFVRGKADSSHVFYGASICAFQDLGQKKGYALVASNSAGNNLFFVRRDLLGNLANLKEKEAKDVYRKAQFRESRDSEGNLTFYGFEERIKMIEKQQVYDIEKQTFVNLGEVLSI